MYNINTSTYTILLEYIVLHIKNVFLFDLVYVHDNSLSKVGI